MDLLALAPVVAALHWSLPLPIFSSIFPPSVPNPHPPSFSDLIRHNYSALPYIMAGEKGPNKRSAMDIKRLASLIQRGTGRLLVIDSRTFSEYNASHVQGAVNVCYSKLVKRRLQQDKVSVTELLHPNGKVKVS